VLSKLNLEKEQLSMKLVLLGALWMDFIKIFYCMGTFRWDSEYFIFSIFMVIGIISIVFNYQKSYNLIEAYECEGVGCWIGVKQQSLTHSNSYLFLFQDLNGG